MSSFETPDREDKDVSVQGGRGNAEQLPRYTARTQLNLAYTGLITQFCAAALTQLLLSFHLAPVFYDRLPAVSFAVALILWGICAYMRHTGVLAGARTFSPIIPFAIIAGVALALS